MKYVNPDIVLNAGTYQDFIKKFTDLEYVAESKYTRQIVFGKMNPKRHITVEKYHFDYEGLDSRYCENFYLLTDFQNN